jgi:rhomboid protease GluP
MSYLPQRSPQDSPQGPPQRPGDGEPFPDDRMTGEHFPSGGLSDPFFNAPRTRFFVRLTPPLLTRILLAANVLVFVAMIVFGVLVFNTWNGTEDGRVLVLFGAKFNPLIDAGEWWRLLTATFLHIGPFHLLFNLYALNVLGPMVEGYYGHFRFAAIYLVGGLLGSIASYAFSDALSAGASGAIFGLSGATTVYFLRYRENFGARGRAILQNMLLVIGVNLVFGLSMPGIDNYAHISGLLGGALAAYGLLPVYRRPQVTVMGGEQALEIEARPTTEAMWVLLCLVLLWVSFRAAMRGIGGIF